MSAPATPPVVVSPAKPPVVKPASVPAPSSDEKKPITSPVVPHAAPALLPHKPDPETKYPLPPMNAPTPPHPHTHPRPPVPQYQAPRPQFVHHRPVAREAGGADEKHAAVPAAIEDGFPGLGRCFLQFIKGGVLDLQERMAGGTGIDEIEDVIASAASDARIDQLAL